MEMNLNFNEHRTNKRKLSISCIKGPIVFFFISEVFFIQEDFSKISIILKICVILIFTLVVGRIIPCRKKAHQKFYFPPLLQIWLRFFVCNPELVITEFSIDFIKPWKANYQNYHCLHSFIFQTGRCHFRRITQTGSHLPV